MISLALADFYHINSKHTSQTIYSTNLRVRAGRAAAPRRRQPRHKQKQEKNITLALLWWPGMARRARAKRWDNKSGHKSSLSLRTYSLLAGIGCACISVCVSNFWGPCFGVVRDSRPQHIKPHTRHTRTHTHAHERIYARSKTHQYLQTETP